MGTKHVIRYGRNPKEETMKYIILASLLMIVGGCKIAPIKHYTSNECCQRLSLHNKEMEKFNRYCKVALFLHRGNTINDKKVKELSKRAVNVCMFVFGAQTEDQLISMSDLNEGYHKVRHYIILPEDSFWRQSLPCDPAEATCEEF
jgi:hypothetical protein